ncbi:MAG: hypothetical protein P4M01_05555 [Acidobacteriota bacterium]|nr:hypothetical protein [Acidobacteriota bacterium]
MTLLLPFSLHAEDGASFDLLGPQVEVNVTRGGRTLPIGQVPNLLAGDRIWVHPALPDNQQAKYLMVVAFLRGATNPPPDNWFTKAETWNKPIHAEGIVVTVPDGAQQALIFLAPQTGGDFNTLRNAVQGKPGAFVRAAVDLQLFSLNRARLEKYLAAIRAEQDPKTLQKDATTLARSLSIKVDESCFTRPVLQQASCLMQKSDQLVLDDGYSQSKAVNLMSGAGGDLLGAISSTSMAGGGAYSPYVGVVVDLARLMENLHTAKYQYISALALPQGDQLHLRLNLPPSFHKPQSVIVIGLPAVQQVEPPIMRPVNPEAVSCAQAPHLTLAAEGAPLVFSSELAHNLHLHVEDSKGHTADIPVTANALQGGFTPTGNVPELDWLPPSFSARIHGEWGFDTFTGPEYKLERSDEGIKWAIPPEQQSEVIAGHDSKLHLQAANSVCVEQIGFRSAKGEVSKVEWKQASGKVEVELPLSKAPAGESALQIKQFGLPRPLEVPLHVYQEDCKLTGFQVHSGDSDGTLKGSCLDEVDVLDAYGLHFHPKGAPVKDVLSLHTDSEVKAARDTTARVSLKDGRVFEVHATALAARPRVQLIGKSIELSASPIHLSGDDDLPADARLQFRIKSDLPFARAEKIEVQSADGFYREELKLENGGLMRQSAHTVVATLAIPKGIAESSFGALHFRAVSPEGFEGDWQPLATLVRLPQIGDVRCPAAKDAPCTLTGNNLFLIQAVSPDADFQHSQSISESLMNSSLDVPRPRGKVLYLRLRDDPSEIHTIEMPSPKTAARKDDKGREAKTDAAAGGNDGVKTAPAQGDPAKSDAAPGGSTSPSSAPAVAPAPQPAPDKAAPAAPAEQSPAPAQTAPATSTDGAPK